MYRKIAALFLCVLNLPALAQGPFAGFYTGTMHLAISGNVTLPERPIGPVAFTIDAAGNISSTGDLSGTVDASGAITWVQPNTANFQTGQITDNTLRSTGRVEHDGTISTYRVEARSSAGSFDGASPFAGRLERANPTEGTAKMIRVRFANGRFVAVGRRGSVAFSQDGRTWSYTGLNTNQDLLDVAYGNGVYVVLGFGGVIYTSPDGVEWTRTAAGGTTFGGSVAFGNGIFMLRQGASTSISTDGVTWTAATVTVPGGLVMSGVDFAGNHFVINSGSQVVITSNGTDLVAGGDAGVGNIITSDANRQKAAFGNGVYVVGGLTGVAYSANGSTWTRGTGPSSRIDTVIFANGGFVIQDAAKTVWTSQNGQTWQAAGSISGGASGMAYGNGVFVSVGAESHSSVDGRVWAQPSVDFTRPDFTAMFWERVDNIPRAYFYHPGYVSADPEFGPTTPGPVRGNYRGSQGNFWFGDNGYIFWFGYTLQDINGYAPVLTDRTLRAGAQAQSSTFIAGDGGVIIRVTRPNSLEAPVFALHPSPTTSDLLHGYNDILVGANGTILKNTHTGNLAFAVIHSGTTETLRHVARYGSSEGVPIGNLMIIVGDNGTILTSPDGSVWTRRESGTTANLVGSAFRASVEPRHYLAAAEDGTLVQSLDGVTWSPELPLPVDKPLRRFEQRHIFTIYGFGDNGQVVTEGGAHFSASHAGAIFFSDAAVGNGRWVLVGNGGASASTDTENWTTTRSGRAFTGVAFGGGRFVGVGQGFTATSGDGINWIFQSLPNRNLTDVTHGSGRFVAVGGSAILVSADGVTWTDKSIPTAALSVVTYGNGRFVATGGNSSATSANDGETWTSAGGALDQRCIAYGNGIFLSAGGSGRVATSANGSSWSVRQLQGPTVLDGRPFFEDLVFVNGEFLGTTQLGVIYRSVDGVTWTHLYAGLNIDPYVAAYANGRLLLARDSEVYFVNMPDAGGPVVAQNPVGGELVEGATLTLTASFTGASLELVWLFNGQPLADGGRVSGANTTTLRIAGIIPEDAGAYSLAANNASGSRVTVAANVSVMGLPRIVQQPANLSLQLGGEGTLSAAVTGAGLSYQWFRNEAAIEGATSAGLAIEGATAAAAGIYQLEIRNSAGMVRSKPASVSVRSQGAGLALDGWNATGPAFGGNRYVSSMAVDPQGRILLYGYFTLPEWGARRDGLLRLNADGSIDGTFNPPVPDSEVNAYHFLPNGQILVGGYFEKMDAVTARGIARLNQDGSLDLTYNPGLAPSYSGALAFKTRGDGKVLAGGAFTTFGGMATIKFLGLLNSDGTADTSFVPSAIQNQVTGLDLQSDGKIIAVGSFSTPASRVARFSAAGQYDSTFNAGQAGIGTAAPFQFPVFGSVTVAAGDKIYVSGRFGTYGGRPAVSLLRLNADGTLDQSFSSGLNAAEVPGPLVQNAVPIGENVLIAGKFLSLHGDATRQHLALVNSSGQATAGLNISTGPNGEVHKLVHAGGGSYILGGAFTQVNGQPRNMLAKLSAQGGEQLPLTITVPQGVTRVAAGGTAVISVGATGHGALSFQWRRGEENLAGQTSATLMLADVQQAEAGVYTVVVTDGNGSATANVELAIDGGEPSGYAGWAAALPAGQRGENDDPDGDRLSNIAEYAMGTNPTLADAAQPPAAATVQVEGQRYAGIRFTRNRNATGVVIEVNASDTVAFTAPAEVVETIEDLGNGIELVTVRSAQPWPAVVRFFLRVNARQN